MAEQNIKLNADQKAVVEREIKSTYNALATLLDWVKSDSLTTEMKETLPNLVDSYMEIVKEAIGFTGVESEKLKEMKESVNQYYKKQVKELQEALANRNSIAGIAANARLTFDKIDKWWGVEGFDYIREKSITAGGYVNLELGFMMDSLTSKYSKTPVSDEEELKTKVQYLTEKGFKFTPKKRGYGLDVLDNDTNRKLLLEMIQRAFPSAKVCAFVNYLRRTNDDQDNYFVLSSVEVMIYDLNDIQELEVEEKYFLFNEDEE